jgi:hypothetical protein
MPTRKKDTAMTLAEIRRWMKRPTAMEELEASIEADVAAIFNRIHIECEGEVTRMHTKH